MLRSPDNELAGFPGLSVQRSLFIHYPTHSNDKCSNNIPTSRDKLYLLNNNGYLLNNALSHRSDPTQLLVHSFPLMPCENITYRSLSVDLTLLLSRLSNQTMIIDFGLVFELYHPRKFKCSDSLESCIFQVI